MADYFGNLLRSGAELFGHNTVDRSRGASSRLEGTPNRSTADPPALHNPGQSSMQSFSETKRSQLTSSQSEIVGSTVESTGASSSDLAYSEMPFSADFSQDSLDSPPEDLPSVTPVQNAAHYHRERLASDSSRPGSVLASSSENSLTGIGKQSRQSTVLVTDNRPRLAPDSSERKASRELRPATSTRDKTPIGDSRAINTPNAGQDSLGAGRRSVEKADTGDDSVHSSSVHVGDAAATRTILQSSRTSSRETPSGVERRGADRFAVPRSIEPPLALANQITCPPSDMPSSNATVPGSSALSSAYPNRRLSTDDREEGIGPVTRRLTRQSAYNEPAPRLETADPERVRSLGSALQSAQPSAGLPEPVPDLMRERTVKAPSGIRSLTPAREHQPKLIIGRLDIQVINQSPERSGQTTRTSAGIAKREEYDSVDRHLLGRFDLI